MVACNIMPVHSILVEVVEDSQAVLGGTTLDQLTVVGLGLVDSANINQIEFFLNFNIMSAEMEEKKVH